MEQVHSVNSQNYAHTQDVLEGLRGQLRSIENAQAVARSSYSKVERSRAHALAAIGGDTESFDTSSFDGRKSEAQSEIDNLAAEHLRVKNNLDRMEGNPTLETAPRSVEEARNKNAIAQVEQVTTGEKQLFVDVPAPAKFNDNMHLGSMLDDPTVSYNTILKALATANAKTIETNVHNIVEQAPVEKTAAVAAQICTSTEKAINVALEELKSSAEHPAIMPADIKSVQNAIAKAGE